MPKHVLHGDEAVRHWGVLAVGISVLALTVWVTSAESWSMRGRMAAQKPEGSTACVAVPSLSLGGSGWQRCLQEAASKKVGDVGAREQKGETRSRTRSEQSNKENINTPKKKLVAWNIQLMAADAVVPQCSKDASQRL